MVRSSLENTGYLSNYSLHIRCSDKIWTGDNSCQVSLMPQYPWQRARPSRCAISALAAWLAGTVVALKWQLARRHRPPASANQSRHAGCPTAQYITNAGPAMYNVTHSPSVPAANQPVVVTAQCA